MAPGVPGEAAPVPRHKMRKAPSPAVPQEPTGKAPSSGQIILQAMPQRQAFLPGLLDDQIISRGRGVPAHVSTKLAHMHVHTSPTPLVA